ncbi:MAG: TetR/AcrR family transcriptional regulator [Acidimicrobiales bacterium]
MPTAPEPSLDSGPDDADPAADGRTARRQRNRDLVVDAALELFAEGMLQPGAAEVAERSGVSLRSVYRYFDDTDALIRAAVQRSIDKVRPLFELEGLGEGPVADRVARIVAGRVRLHEEVAPMVRANLQRAPTNEILRETQEGNWAALRRQVEAMFEPELAALEPAAAAEVAAALDVLLGFHSIEHLRRSAGLSPEQTRRTLVRAVGAVLATP